MVALPIPDELLKKVNTLIFNYLWGSKKDNIKRNTVIERYVEGGLQMINLNSVIHCATRQTNSQTTVLRTEYLEIHTDVLFEPIRSQLFNIEVKY